MRETVKKAVRLLFALMVLPLVLLNRALAGGSGVLSPGCTQVLALLPGVVGRYARAEFYGAVLRSCHRSVALDFGVLLPYADVSIGEGVYIGPYSIIAESVIGKDSIIGSYVSVIGGRRNHVFDDVDTPIRLQGRRHEAVHIGEDCWIGNKAVIMANVGRKCVIGAGSVVVNDIPDYAVAVGNPARVVRDRRNIPEQESVA